MTLERAQQIQQLTAAIFVAAVIAMFIFAGSNSPIAALPIIVVLQASMWTSLAMLFVIWRKKKAMKVGRNG